MSCYLQVVQLFSVTSQSFVKLPENLPPLPENFLEYDIDP